MPGGHIDRLTGDANAIAKALVSAADRGRRTEQSAHLDGLPLLDRPADAVQIALQLEYALARHHRNRLDAREIGGQRLGNALPDPVVSGASRDVGEVQDGNDRFARAIARGRRRGHGQRGVREIDGGQPRAAARGIRARPAPGRQQVDVEVARGLVAELGALLQRLADDGLHILRHGVVVAGDRVGLVMQDAIGDLAQRVGDERQPSGEHLVEHHAGRKQIGAIVDGATRQLLGSHVIQRAENESRRRDIRERADVAGARRRDELRQAEIEHLHQMPIGDHHVRALDVAMDDAALMRLVQRVGQLQRDVQGLGDR
jgi:hypothetical protein